MIIKWVLTEPTHFYLSFLFLKLKRSSNVSIVNVENQIFTVGPKIKHHFPNSMLKAINVWLNGWRILSTNAKWHETALIEYFLFWSFAQIMNLWRNYKLPRAETINSKNQIMFRSLSYSCTIIVTYTKHCVEKADNYV